MSSLHALSPPPPVGFYTDMVLRSCEKALAGIILLPLVCLGSFRLCGTAGSSAARGPGAGAGRAGDTIGGGGGGVGARDPRAFVLEQKESPK